MSRKAKAERALKVQCPSCSADPEEPCRDWRGHAILYPHNRRVTVAMSNEDWNRRPEIDNYQGSIDSLIAALQGAKQAGFNHIFFDSGVAPIYTKVR